MILNLYTALLLISVSAVIGYLAGFAIGKGAGWNECSNYYNAAIDKAFEPTYKNWVWKMLLKGMKEVTDDVDRRRRIASEKRKMEK